MKNITKDIVKKFKSLNINLLDGQRRGEIVFRRVFLLVVIYLILLFIAHSIGLKTKPVAVTQADIVEVEVVDTTPKDGDVVMGQEVDVDEQGKVWYVQEYTPKNAEIEKIRAFTKSYRGSRLNDTYFNQIVQACNEDASLVRTVVAISVAETGMGRDVKRQSNFYGWFKNGNRKYDPSTQEMASEICRGVGKYYRNIGKNEAVTKRYVGGDVKVWTRNFNWAIKQM